MYCTFKFDRGSVIRSRKVSAFFKIIGTKSFEVFRNLEGLGGYREGENGCYKGLIVSIF